MAKFGREWKGLNKSENKAKGWADEFTTTSNKGLRKIMQSCTVLFLEI